MRPRYRELTEKYKLFRLPPDALYSSRLVQTFFNKFTKKGKKALARHHMHKALIRLRLSLRRPQMFFALLRIFRRLHVQFLLVSKREGRKIINVPIPVRRNKREVLSLQVLCNEIKKGKDLTLSGRIYDELKLLSFKPHQSPLLRQLNAEMHDVYKNRVEMSKRWK